MSDTDGVPPDSGIVNTSEQVDLAKDLLGRYLAGESLRRLSEDTGYSDGSVRRLLLDAGAELRPPTVSDPSAIVDP